MKKIISTFLVLAMMFTMVNIPVTFATGDIGLVDITEDYTTYTSASELTGWELATINNIANVGLVQGEGLQIKMVNPTSDQTSNSTMTKTLERKVEVADNRTVLTQTGFQGKYEISLGLDVNFATGDAGFATFYVDTIAARLKSGGTWDVRKSGPVGTRNNKLKYTSDGDNHANVKYTINTADDSLNVEIDGTSESIDISGTIDKIEVIKLAAMDKHAAGTAFTINNLQVKQIETAEALATLAVVNALPEKLTDEDLYNVTANLTGITAVNGVTWESSDPTTISTDGTVTRQSEDKEVVITATVDLNNNGGVFTKTYTMTVPKADVPDGDDNTGSGGTGSGDDNTGSGDDNTGSGDDNTGSGDDNTGSGDDNTGSGDDNTGSGDDNTGGNTGTDLIVANFDFTQYSDIEDVPNISYVNDEYSVVRAEKGTGIVIDQILTSPLNAEGTENAASNTTAVSNRFIHMAEAVFNEDEANRTNYRTNTFEGAYEITVDFETEVPDYKYTDITGTEWEFKSLYYSGYTGCIKPDEWVQKNMLFHRFTATTLTTYSSSSSGDSTLTNPKPKYSGTVHTMRSELDTVKNTVKVYADTNKTPTTGPFKNLYYGYVNYFGVSSRNNFSEDAYFIIKNIKYVEMERSESTAAAIATLDLLPSTLGDESPYAITENITLPNVSDSIVWSSSDPAIISNNGEVARWYDDREVTLTATCVVGNVTICKDYKLTVKAFDSYESKVIMNNSGNALSDVSESGDISMGAYTVSDNGIVVEKVVDGADASAEQEVYYVDYRLFGEEVAYNTDTYDSILTAGYSGIYDIDFNITPSISGDKPIYIALGSEDGGYSKLASLRVSKENLAVVNKDGRTKVYNITNADGDFDIRYRIDTDKKLVWVFVNDKLTGSPFAYENIEFADSLRVILDKNNNKGDKVTLNNVVVTEIVKNEITTRDALKNALNTITVSDITSDSATAVSSIKALPSTVGGYDVVWSSNNDSIDVVNSKVYFSESATDVVVSAMVNDNGVYVKKNFYLTVRTANTNDEILDGYIGDLPEFITKQASNDIRYDLNLPLSYSDGKVSIEWTSSKPEYISNDGKVMKDVAILEPTEVVLSAKITMNGKEYDREYTYTVSPRAYDNVVYEGSGDAESISINGYDNIKITRDSVTEITFSQSGNGSIAIEDSNGKKIATINVNSGLYSVVYGSGVSENYPVGTSTTLKVMVMPDIDRIAVWNSDGRIVDYGKTIENVDNLAKIDASDAINVSETKISTDEYGLLDINLSNIGYFDIFAKNVITGTIDLVGDTVFSADVKWESSDEGIISDDGVISELPDNLEIVEMTLTLTSTEYGSVKRSASKKFVVPCLDTRNYAKDKETKSSVAEKPGYLKEYLTDGKYDNSYGTAGVNSKPEIIIDLGNREYFNALYINEDFALYDKSLKSYTLSYSNDGETWTVIKNGTIDGIESTIIRFDTVYARYVSFVATECESRELYINEIGIYLFVNSQELVELEIKSLDFAIEGSVQQDLQLPKYGRFGTELEWSSDNTGVISIVPSTDEITGEEKITAVVTRPLVDTTVTLTVTAKSGTAECSNMYAAYVPVAGGSGSGGSGGSLVSGGSGSGVGGYVSGAGAGGSALPGFTETDITTPVVTETEFKDVDSTHWAYENIKKLNELGIVNGVGDGKFDPTGVVTREQFLKMLVEAVDIETGSTETDFDDVDSSSWYASYVAAGVDAGLVNGVTSTSFGVGSEIKRQDMAAMIVRILNNKNIVVTQTSEVFDDDSNISDYAKEAVYKVRDAGIIQGYAGKFNPMDSLTRAEAATVIIKLLEVLQ